MPRNLKNSIHASIHFFILFALAIIVPGKSFADPAKHKLDAKAILDNIDDMYRGKSSKGKMIMKVVTEHWSREMTLEFYSRGKDLSLARILSPKKEKGMATLRNGKNIWNYLPKVNRVMKVPSSMMGSSWMGSHFTNDDLVKESRMADDYDFKVDYQGKRDGQDVIEILCTPKKRAAVVWGKIVVRVRASDYEPLVITYFDEDMMKSREMRFSDFRKIGGRLIPTTLKMVPEDKPGEYTLVKYEDIDFNVELKDSLFTIRGLQR